MDKDATLEDVQRHFAKDHFATGALGARVVEVSRGHAVCEFDIGQQHLNEKGGVMGGAIFTLADLAVVAASAIGGPESVSVNFDIEFMSAAKGTKLIATADADKEGRRLGFYRCLVEDDLKTPVARVTGTIMHLG